MPCSTRMTMDFTAFCLFSPELNLSRSLRSGGRAADADLDAVDDSGLLVLAEVVDHLCGRAEPPGAMVQPLWASSGRASPIARVMVEPSTLNQQASTSWVAPWRR